MENRDVGTGTVVTVVEVLLSTESRKEKALSIIPRLKTFLVFLLPKNRRELGGYRYREKQQLYHCLEVVQKPKLDA